VTGRRGRRRTSALVHFMQ